MPDIGPGPVPPVARPPVAGPQPLCRAAELIERGKAVLFDVQLWGQPARAFALRFEGRLVGYVNRCAHVPVEMDWQAGEFLDHDKQVIVCAMHGARYNPANGSCLGGPCGQARLMPVRIDEQAGWACWYPSSDIRPILPAPALAADRATDPDPESPP